MSITMTRTELRTHYKTISDMITEERRLRESVLANSPKLPAKLKKCDDALAALAALGNALGNLLPPEGPVTIQEVLFDVPEMAGKRGGY